MLKWVWKLIARPQSIWALWVNRYNLKGTDLWSAQQSISHSWYWNNVVKVKDFLLASAGSRRIALDWIHACSDSTTFHTAKMYQLVRQGAEEVPWYSLVQDRQCVPKHSFFGVLAFHDKLPTIDNLAHRGLHLVNRCALCCAHNESVEHLFFQCAFSSQVWVQIAAWLQACPSSLLDQVVSWYLTQCHGVRAGSQRAGLLATMYYLWQERNGRIFRGVLSTPESICIRVKFVVSNRSF
ncbi:uncharacterized protein LOC141632308 [Silene latifolia]|uniref:uncharacterized protein LOC141632308 n=1 Tax=Silene latifolia TaxID=37657 RepID=UPI003D788F5C